jgi:hypothetical protein
MTTSTLTDFVEARIAEDEAEARKVEAPLPVRGYATVTLAATDTIAALYVDPARVLAQCAAMRKIVESAEWAESMWTNDSTPYTRGCVVASRVAVESLASIWSGHPQFDPAWA